MYKLTSFCCMILSIIIPLWYKDLCFTSSTAISLNATSDKGWMQHLREMVQMLSELP